MTPLEQQYRAALRWYPISWRSQNADALIGTLLDAAEAQNRSDSTYAEIRDLHANGIRQYGLEIIPPSVRSRASSMSLGIGTALAVVLLIGLEWAPWVPTGARKNFDVPVGFGPFVSVGAVVDLLWIAAFVTGMLGHRLLTNVAIVLSIVASLVFFLVPASPWMTARPSATSLAVMAILGLFVLLAHPAPDGRGAGWIAVALAASLTAIAVFHWQEFPPPGIFGTRGFWETFPLLWVGILFGAVALLFAALRWWAWCGAAFVVLVPLWIGLLTTSTWYLPYVELIPALLLALFFGLLVARTLVPRRPLGVAVILTAVLVSAVGLAPSPPQASSNGSMCEAAAVAGADPRFGIEAATTDVVAPTKNWAHVSFGEAFASNGNRYRWTCYLVPDAL